MKFDATFFLQVRVFDLEKKSRNGISVSATHVSLISVLKTYMCMHQGSPAELYCKKSWQHQVSHLLRKCESEINTVIIIGYSCYSAQTTTVWYGLLCKWFKPLNYWSCQMQILVGWWSSEWARCRAMSDNDLSTCIRVSWLKFVNPLIPMSDQRKNTQTIQISFCKILRNKYRVRIQIFGSKIHDFSRPFSKTIFLFPDSRLSNRWSIETLKNDETLLFSWYTANIWARLNKIWQKWKPQDFLPIFADFICII